MIAANHPALGMNPHQSGDNLAPLFSYRPVPLPSIRPGPPPSASAGPSAPPAVIEPGSGVQQYHPIPGQINPVPINLQTAAPASVPGSAGATGAAGAVADSGAAPFSLSDWLTEETLFAGYPNGLVAAGGVIVLFWLLGGKRGRR